MHSGEQACGADGIRRRMASERREHRQVMDDGDGGGDVAAPIFSEIIELSNLSVEELGELKENFLKENNSILNNLENNLRNFKKKYRRIAIKELNQLSEILEGLN